MSYRVSVAYETRMDVRVDWKYTYKPNQQITYVKQAVCVVAVDQVHFQLIAACTSLTVTR